MPSHLHIYALSACSLYSELDAAQRRLEAAITAHVNPTRSDEADAGDAGHWAVGGGAAAAASAGSLAVPSLRWDTSVLDVEEDRVIWVRETDLGQAVRELPEGPPERSR